jgi:hypothetical protein
VPAGRRGVKGASRFRGGRQTPGRGGRPGAPGLGPAAAWTFAAGINGTAARFATRFTSPRSHLRRLAEVV